jgi:hypothetical protein
MYDGNEAADFEKRFVAVAGAQGCLGDVIPPCGRRAARRSFLSEHGAQRRMFFKFNV